MPSQCYINLEQKTDLIPLNICQGFNVVDNITSTIGPGITIIHFHQTPVPMASKRILLEISKTQWLDFIFLLIHRSQMLELLLFSQLFVSINCKVAVFPYYRGSN